MPYGKVVVPRCRRGNVKVLWRLAPDERNGCSMAKRTFVKLIDDLDKTSDADETVRFGLDGVEYEIDLSAAHAAELRQALEPYVAAGTRIGGRRRAGTRRSGAASAKAEENRKIREWARAQGIKVSDRGRIAEETVNQYYASQKQG